MGIDQAETYVRRLGQHMALIARQPDLGSPCPEIRADYRRFPCEAHVLFYRVAQSDVEVVVSSLSFAVSLPIRLPAAEGYPPGECRLAMLNPAGDLKGALKSDLKDRNGIGGGDHHRCSATI